MSALVRCCVTRRPSVILTTSSVAGTVAEYVKSQSGASAPSIVEVDLLDLDAPTGSGAGCENHPSTAYLQYTSGSTRQPAGVMMSHRNLLANFEQLMSDYFADYGERSPARHHYCVVAAVLSRHGFVSGNLRADSARELALCSRARWRSCSGRPGGCNCWQAIVTHTRQHRTSRSNWRREKHRTMTWPGLISADVLSHHHR